MTGQDAAKDLLLLFVPVELPPHWPLPRQQEPKSLLRVQTRAMVTMRALSAGRGEAEYRKHNREEIARLER